MAPIFCVGKSTPHEGIHRCCLMGGFYDRWEYVDRNFGVRGCGHAIDGTNHAVFWGNNRRVGRDVPVRYPIPIV